MRNFAAIDFETANNEPTSVCSVGIVIVRNCQIVDSFYSLIKTEPEYYDYWCSQVHGLTIDDTREAPLFPAVWDQIAQKIEGLPLIAHNKAFDENCLKSVFRCYQMEYPDYEFHCTLLKSRRVWPFGHHNLDIIAERCGYCLDNHHHALADAEACAAIAIKLYNHGGDPYFMEPSDIVYNSLKQFSDPVKAAQLESILSISRKDIDKGLKRLKTEGRACSPKRGYWVAK